MMYITKAREDTKMNEVRDRIQAIKLLEYQKKYPKLMKELGMEIQVVEKSKIEYGQGYSKGNGHSPEK